ncbi:MAG: CHC2 zinc finger domain-containing protein, partial [Dialister micraerophilus]|nr:CHC2 zinc finger domain-containing protein [Dialister micraerophilus]
MKNFDNNFIQRIKDSLPIEQVIGAYVPLKKKGRSFWACCPFHQEKTPSFSVSPDKGFYHCFGCNESGDIVS